MDKKKTDKPTEASPEAKAKRKAMFEANHAKIGKIDREKHGLTNGKRDTQEETPDNRDEKGLFKPGHTTPGPGRPAVVVERDYAGAFRRACSAEDLAEVIGVVLNEAIKGDIRAAQLIFKYALPAVVEIVDKHELRVAGQTPTEVNAMMMARVGRLMSEQAAREAELRANGDYLDRNPTDK